MMDEFNKSLKLSDKRKSLLNEKRVKLIIKLMQNNTVDELVKDGVISKRSKYNYLNIIRAIGIDKNAILDIEIEASNDFKGYYNKS